MLVNYALIAAAVVFILVVAYRIIASFAGGRRTFKEEVRPTPQRIPRERVSPESTPKPPEAKIDVSDLFSSVDDRQRESIMESADKMVDYSLAHGDGTRIRPESLRAMAKEFGLLEAVLDDISRREGWEGISEKQRREILREAFRLVVSAKDK